MGCSSAAAADGSDALDSSGYNTPVPWVGLYIASASVLCSLAMAADAFAGLRRGKRWFPSRFFSLNATTLTLLGIATKLPVDLTSPMPSRLDQLSKLSGTALLSAATANFLPSLGDTSDAAPNVIALAILVLTVAVNICIQIATGVVFAFLPEHAAVLLLMLVLLLLLCSSALTVATTKQLLETQFDSKHSDAGDVTEGNLSTVSALREFVKKYWLMAHTCSPQFVLGRSATCTASGAFSLLSAGVLMEATVRSMIKEDWKLCSGGSDYKWSTTVVLFSQVVAVIVGTIAPAYRWFSAVSFRSPQDGRWSCRDLFIVEDYWVQRLVELREAPLDFQIGSRRIRKITHQWKTLILETLIGLQSGVVLVSKFVRLVSVVPVNWLNRGRRLLTRTKTTFGSSTGDGRIGSSSDLSYFVMHLEGESGLVRLMMKTGRKDTEKWIQRGSNNQPAHLVELIERHSTASYGFKGTGQFDSERVISLVSEELPNCWALPLVTLTSIAVATLPEASLLKSLLCGVSEGLKYVRLVEKHLDAKGLVNMREAADLVWLSVDLYDRWLDQDLRGLVCREQSGRKAIERLGDVAKERVLEFLGKMKDGDETGNNPLRWPEKVLAANCMYRVSRTILQECDENPRTDRDLFLWLQAIISDILGACMTNLPRVIYMECVCCAIEVREKSVQEAAFLLGEAENILKILGEDEVMCLYPERREYIDDWRKRMQNHSSGLPSTTTNNLTSSTTDELSVFIG